MKTDPLVHLGFMPWWMQRYDNKMSEVKTDWKSLFLVIKMVPMWKTKEYDAMTRLQPFYILFEELGKHYLSLTIKKQD